MKKCLMLVLAALLIIFGLFGCTPASQGGNSKAGEDILRVAVPTLDGVFNPLLARDVFNGYVNSMIFEPLVGNDDEGNPAGVLADWTVSEDGLTYTFALKDGVTFHNGKPLTAEDVKFTYEALLHPEYDGGYAYMAQDIVGAAEYTDGKADEVTGIAVVNEKTVAITIAAASASRIYDFAIGILNKDYYAFSTIEELKAKNLAPVGTGRFKFDSFAAGQSCKLKAYENYHGKKAQIDGVTMLIVPDETAISALGAGNVDLIHPAASKDSEDAIKALDGASAIVFPGKDYTFIGVNHQDAILSDRRVRQALYYGLDVAGFIESQYQGLASRVLAPISPQSWAYPDKSELNGYDFDPEKAKSLLEEAGWKAGNDGIRVKKGKKLTLTVMLSNNVPWPEALASLATEQWGDIGVELKSDVMDFNTLMAKVFGAREAQLWLMSIDLTAEPDPIGLLDKASFVNAQGYNAGGFVNEDAEELFAAGRAEFNQQERAVIYKNWAKLANEELPYLCIASPEELWGVSGKVKGLDNFGTFYSWTDCLGDVTIS